ncbi:uncharacterized protein LOC128223364 [Mya arenaria]|uniref:uncharacterized protein LOC128223364 n=1 Tax=Mya arenaria TaxID=6604 RepID=UPI0022E58FC7|nr:uncharacterized protein LOC128223364 [Mya arenaria]
MAAIYEAPEKKCPLVTNLPLTPGRLRDKWAEGWIVPRNNKGSINDPNNFRAPASLSLQTKSLVYPFAGRTNAVQDVKQVAVINRMSGVTPLPAIPGDDEFRASNRSTPYIAVSGARTNTRISTARIGTTTYLFNRSN